MSVRAGAPYRLAGAGAAESVWSCRIIVGLGKSTRRVEAAAAAVFPRIAVAVFKPRHVLSHGSVSVSFHRIEPVREEMAAVCGQRKYGDGSVEFQSLSDEFAALADIPSVGESSQQTPSRARSAHAWIGSGQGGANWFGRFWFRRFRRRRRWSGRGWRLDAAAAHGRTNRRWRQWVWIGRERRPDDARRRIRRHLLWRDRKLRAANEIG